MKYVKEYRQPRLVKLVSESLHKATTHSWTIMEVCGGQTHTIVKYGLNSLLPKEIRLIHGPGCPVCVTPIGMIDRAIHIAQQPGAILCSFGDMVRVPGTALDLLTAKAKGGDVRIVYSPLEAVAIAERNPAKEVIFFAVGFETTAAPNAMAIYQAKKRNVKNFSALVSHVLVPPALRFILDSPGNEVQGFLAAGHACTVTGYGDYHSIAETYQVPLVVTGFEPLDILQGLLSCVQQLEKGGSRVVNQYSRSVKEEGNLAAQKIIDEVFQVADREWRGIGLIPQSGYELSEDYADFNAAVKFSKPAGLPVLDTGCISGLILQGKKKPFECPLFGKKCRPESPLGAPMVSNEGACAAYYNYIPDKA